jgi:alginate O-acetyltransferase complex protein AlgI
MLFNTLEFFIFFPIVTILYFLLPFKSRWLWLLTASCYFYMAFVPIYILILGGTIVIDYFAGLYIEKSSEPKKRKWLLVVSLISNIAVLFVFKYYNFFIGNFNGLFEKLNLHHALPYLTILLPIGLSFHTFQAMSYTIEVYRGNQKAEKHFGIYALYVMFYPQLVAGPIERPQNILHQFHEKKKFDYNNLASGLKLMAWGLFKKVVIADRLSDVVNKVYSSPTEYSSIPLIIATLFFTIQIYCDFSGYSDMAIGAARTMGFKLMKNFNRPYAATSISEFWKRWHISLSTWFKDYLYIPLGGNRVKISRVYFNLLIVFIISGFWHGANWTFIVWGALHGFYLVFALISKGFRKKISDATKLNQLPKLNNLFKILVTFALVSFAWIFFRASNISEAFYIAKTAVLGFPSDVIKVLRNENMQRLNLLYLGYDKLTVVFLILPIIILQLVQFFQYKLKRNNLLEKQPVFIRLAGYSMLILLIIFFGKFGSLDFIYFQF